ncbi:MAG: UDP-N-acetylglucosamine 2-epimerase (non-hydrolyzing) [Pseudanabaenaceae cyanobacterium bins.39]|nr:UDP-N-acetylglucosamine 2-epimerase (non-hydrolyzing) [Pseudanabaenaceae cyanobacterium bins.39]
MKILTILGTRPEIIRLSLVIKKLDQACNHVLVHTGQNFDKNLSDVFFQQLQVREPDYFLGIRGESFGEQIGKIIMECEKVLRQEQPDKLLLLGDTNSSLAAIAAKRLAIPVFHMEAGNRCYDDRVPEEINRRIIDHSSDILLPYTERSRDNLLREGIRNNKIYVTGNPIFEVIQHHQHTINQSDILQTLNIQPQNYFLVTMHRQENVDIQERLTGILTSLERLQAQYQVPIVCSLHPRTKHWMQNYNLEIQNPHIHLCEPFNFFDFIHLEQNAKCVLSDSGTVQEECCIFRVPNVTIRDVTERPETIESGSNILSGAFPEDILRCVQIVLNQPSNWEIPPEYTAPSVSDKIVKLLASNF